MTSVKVVSGFIAAFAVFLAMQPWPRHTAAYAVRRRIAPDDGTIAALGAQLRRSRSLVAAAIFGSAAVSIVTSGPDRIDLRLGWIAASWFVAALIDVAWMLPRNVSTAAIAIRPAPRWVMRSLVAMVVIVAATALTLARVGSGDEAGREVRGGLAVGAALLVNLAVLAIGRRPGLVAGGPDLDAALRASAVQRVVAPGVLTAGLGLVSQIGVLRDHTGPLVSDALDTAAYAVAIGALVLAWTLRTAVRWRGPLFPLLAATAVLGAAALSAAITGQAAAKEHPPFTAAALHPAVNVDAVTDATVDAREHAYGFRTLPAATDPGDGATLFFGRLTLGAPPVPAQGQYWLVAIDGSAERAVALGDADSGGAWGSDLDAVVAKYPWLSPFAMVRTAGGWESPPSAEAVFAPAGARTIMFWGYAPPGVAPADLTFGLIYLGTDDQVYWATQVPVT